MNRLSMRNNLIGRSSRLRENYQSRSRSLWNIPQINIEKLNNVHM